MINKLYSVMIQVHIERLLLKKTVFMMLVGKVFISLMVFFVILSANVISKLLNFRLLKLKISVPMDMICFSINLKGNWIAGQGYIMLILRNGLIIIQMRFLLSKSCLLPLAQKELPYAVPKLTLLIYKLRVSVIKSDI